MSSKATTWAWDQRHVRGAQKLLLLALADCCNAYTGLAFPSVEQLVDMTGQDRKTIFANLKRLTELGIMTDTGKRTGRTQQIIVWKMAVKGPEIGTVKGSQKRTGKSPNFPMKESQIWDTEPIREPNKGTESNHYDGPPLETDLFGQEVQTPEQREAKLKADTIAFVETGWNDLSMEIPGVAALRGLKLDEPRADTAFQRAMKFAAAGETAVDVWTAVFRQIRSSRWLCGETQPRDDRPPFKLQLTWLLENRNFTKVLEGKYADGRDPDIRGGGSARPSPAGEAMSVVLDRRRAGRDRRTGRGSGSGLGAR